MEFSEGSLKPIFIQLTEWVEDQIINDTFKGDEQIPSTNQFALEFSINPATANKGFNILVESGVIYKKRGIGMFVCPGAKEIIRKKRTDNFTNEYLNNLISEANKLKITKNELISLINQNMD